VLFSARSQVKFCNNFVVQKCKLGFIIACPVSGKDHTFEMNFQKMKAHKIAHDPPFFTFIYFR